MKKISFLLMISLFLSCSNSSDRSYQNVSTLITLERQLQIANQSECWKSIASYQMLNALLHDKTAAYRNTKILAFKRQMEKIDEASFKIISEIDEIKLNLLKSAQENTDIQSSEKCENIVTNCSKIEHFGSQMLYLNLNGIVDKLNTKATEEVIFSHSMETILWKDYNSFIAELMRTLGTYTLGTQEFSFEPHLIYKGMTYEKWMKEFETSLQSSKANLREDQEILKELFSNLKKPETVVLNTGEEVSWMEYTFKHTTIVEAISQLTTLQHEVLKAKSMALTHIRSRISFCGDYSFNTFLPIVTGPSSVRAGEEVEIKIRTGAYNRYNQPIISCSLASVAFDGDGAATVKFKAKKGENNLSGTIYIKKKSGEISARSWEWSVYGIQEK